MSSTVLFWESEGHVLEPGHGLQVVTLDFNDRKSVDLGKTEDFGQALFNRLGIHQGRQDEPLFLRSSPHPLKCSALEGKCLSLSIFFQNSLKRLRHRETGEFLPETCHSQFRASAVPAKNAVCFFVPFLAGVQTLGSLLPILLPNVSRTD